MNLRIQTVILADFWKFTEKYFSNQNFKSGPQSPGLPWKFRSDFDIRYSLYLNPLPLSRASQAERIQIFSRLSERELPYLNFKANERAQNFALSPLESGFLFALDYFIHWINLVICKIWKTTKTKRLSICSADSVRSKNIVYGALRWVNSFLV